MLVQFCDRWTHRSAKRSSSSSSGSVMLDVSGRMEFFYGIYGSSRGELSHIQSLQLRYSPQQLCGSAGTRSDENQGPKVT